jgi:glycosyl transferase family 25
MVKQITNSLNELATKNDFDVCLLTYVTKYSDWGSRKIPESEHQLVKVFDAYLGYGYIVTNYGARRLLNHLSTLYHPFDYWNTFRRQGVVSVKAIIPYVVGESDLGSDSEIDDERRRISADLAFGRTVALQRFVRRFFYEKFIYQIVKPVMRIRRQPKGTLERECQASIPTDPR